MTETQKELLARCLNTLNPVVFQEGAEGVPVERLMTAEGIKGLQCGIATIGRDGKTDIAVQSSGVNNLGKKIDDSTISECASLSKPVAASWVIEYCLANGFDIQTDSINALIEHGVKKTGQDAFDGWRVRDNAGNLFDVPIARFMSHTSGVGGHYVFGCPPDKEPQHPLSILRGEEIEGYPVQSKFTFRCAPGAEVNYSGTSYILLQMLTIHLCGNRPYQGIMAEYLAKFGMNDSTFDHKKIKDKPLMTTDYLCFPEASAGMYTTTSDFLKFTAAVINAWQGHPSPLSQKAAKLMLTSAMSQREFIGLDPGHGFFVIEQNDGSVTFAHQGANENFRILVIANTSGGAIYSVANSDFGTPLNCTIARRLMVELGFPSVREKTVPAYAPAMEKLSGSYQTPKGRVDIVFENRQLFRDYKGLKVPLYPEDAAGKAFVHSGTAQTYLFEGDQLTLTDINRKNHSGQKSASATGEMFDDRAYNIDDPAKLVNLQIRDQLNL